MSTRPIPYRPRSGIRYERLYRLHDADGSVVYRVVDPSSNRRDIFVRRDAPSDVTRAEKGRWRPVTLEHELDEQLYILPIWRVVSRRTYPTRYQAADAAIRRVNEATS